MAGPVLPNAGGYVLSMADGPEPGCGAPHTAPTPAQLGHLADLLAEHPQVSDIRLRWEDHLGTTMVTAYVVAADPYVIPRLDRLRALVTTDELRRWMPRRLKLVRSLPPGDQPRND